MSHIIEIIRQLILTRVARSCDGGSQFVDGSFGRSGSSVAHPSSQAWYMPPPLSLFLFVCVLSEVGVL